VRIRIGQQARSKREGKKERRKEEREREREREREKPAFIHIAYRRHASRNQRRYLAKIGATSRRHETGTD